MSALASSGLPPGPNTAPLLQLVRWLRRPLPLLDEMARRFGDAFTLRTLAGPAVVVFSAPAAVRDIFTADPEELSAGEANVVLKSVLGEHSLLLLDGSRHLRERRLMLPPFHGERMKRYGDLMRDATLRAMGRWPRGDAFPLHPEMQAITLEVILRAVFGLEQEARLVPMRDALVRWTTMGSSRLGTALLLSVPPERAEGLRAIADAEIALGPLRLPIGRLAPWAPLMRAKQAVDPLLNAEIAARRAVCAGRDDVLSMLLEARDEDGAPMTDAELHDEMLTLLVAGHETSATTLAWAVHHLAANPDAMGRACAELHRVVGRGPLQVEHLPQLEWLDAVIKETLRLTPIVPMVGRRLARPARIGGHDLPGGEVALACVYLTHRRAELWPDPTRYDPARFVGRKIDPYHYYPFGGGTRRCLGKAFAEYEIKIVLATILSQLSLRASPGRAVRVVRRGVTFAPSGGLPVVATARA